MDSGCFLAGWTFPPFPCKARRVPAASTEGLGDEARLALGRAVRAARVGLGIDKLDDLATASGVSRKTIGKIESGQVVSEKSIVALEPHIGWTENEWLRRVQQFSDEAAERVKSIERSEHAFDDFRADEERRVYLLEKITVASRELAAATEELARLELGDRGRPMPSLIALPGITVKGEQLAALQTGTVSYREALDAAQDEAAEAPDAPGPEHGA